MDRSWAKKLINDIRFWILIFLMIRLVGIINAPLETGHNWRQSLTAMIARNFYEGEANLLYPRIDIAGEKTGIIGSEFPIFNYLIYLVAEVFGYQHWYGRLINLLVSSVGVFFFYQLVTRILNKRVAFNVSLILLSSIWFAFSRKIMPDTFSISLMLIGLYFGYNYLKGGGWQNILLFLVFCTTGMLAKIPALALFSSVALVLLYRDIGLQRKTHFLLTSALSFAVVCLWYFYWVPYLLDTYQYQLYFPKSFTEGLHEIIPLWPELLEKFYFSALHSFIGFACVVAGLIYLFRSNHSLIKTGFILVFIIFILFIIKTGSIFPTHNYYIIPFVPLMALAAGYFLALVPVRYQNILLTLILIEGVVNQQHDFFIKDNQLYKLKLEQTLAEELPEDELIIINGGKSPQSMYFAHRRGWTEETSLLNVDRVDSLRRMGADYLVIDKHRGSPEFNYHGIYEDEDYVIYKL